MGLWDRWQDGEGKAIESCTILTTEANDVLRPVHDRMPVILHSEEYTLWLSGDERQRGLLTEFVRPYPAEAMVGYPVSPLVNSTRNKGLELTAEVQLNSA